MRISNERAQAIVNGAPWAEGAPNTLKKCAADLLEARAIIKKIEELARDGYDQDYSPLVFKSALRAVLGEYNE